MYRFHGDVNNYKQAIKINFVYLQAIWSLEAFTICTQQACNDAHKLTQKHKKGDLTERSLIIPC